MFSTSVLAAEYTAAGTTREQPMFLSLPPLRQQHARQQ